MKKLLLLPLLLLIACSGKAQQQSGTITYERKLTFSKKDLENSNLPEGFAEMIAQGKKAQKVLYFSPDATLFENNTAAPANDDEYTEGNMMIRSSGFEPDEKVFVDLKNKKRTEQKDLMGKQFLIQNEPVTTLKWKTTGRQKKILGFSCMEAVTVASGADGEESKMTAWYTTAIPVSSGPEGVTGLPGMILEIAMGGSISYTAIKVDAPNGKINGLIKALVKGKKISAKEFEQLSQQKIREMEQQMQGGGSFMIKTER